MLRLDHGLGVDAARSFVPQDAAGGGQAHQTALQHCDDHLRGRSLFLCHFVHLPYQDQLDSCTRIHAASPSSPPVTQTYR